MRSISESSNSPTLSLIIVLGMLTAFGSLSIDMYLPAFPDMARELGTTIPYMELSLSFFFGGFAFGQLIYGPLSDRFGRRAPVYFGLVLYALASAGCAMATSVHALLALRLVQALGGCAGIIIARAVVRDRFMGNEAARVFSLLMLVSGLAPILAPLLGGAVAAGLGWRWIFGLQASFGVICLLVAHFVLPESLPISARSGQRLTVSGALGNYRKILQDPCFLGYTLSGALASAGMFAYIAGSPYVVIELFHVHKGMYGWMFGANAFGLIAGAQINARLLRTRPLDGVLRGAYFCMLLAVAYNAAVLAFGGGLWWLAPGLFFYVASIGFVGPNYASGALMNQGGRAGAASALLGTAQFVFAALASVLVSRLHDGTAWPMVLTMAACITLSVTIYGWVAPFRRCAVPV